MILSTTVVRTKRFTTTPGETTTVLAAAPAVVGRVSGSEQAAFRGSAPAGWREELSASLITDHADIAYNDIVEDAATGLLYRAVSSVYRPGLGLDHQKTLLVDYSPTGSYSVLRGSTTDEYGDAVPSPTAAYSGLPATIREVSRDVNPPATQQEGTVRRYEGRFPPHTVLKPRDRILSDSGDTYVVVSAQRLSEAEGADVGCELMKVTE